jgi:YbbR domain-containing protein
MMKNWLLNNLGLKIVALILAVAVWLYVGGELEKQTKLETIRDIERSIAK